MDGLVMISSSCGLHTAAASQVKNDFFTHLILCKLKKEFQISNINADGF
jgi:hypothetical protein